MFEFSSSHTAIVIAVFILAGFVKGVTGMGLPTVAMGVLGAVMSPVNAASLLIIPSFVTNVWQLLTGQKLAELLWRLRLMMLGIVIGTIARQSRSRLGWKAAEHSNFETPLLLYWQFFRRSSGWALAN